MDQVISMVFLGYQSEGEATKKIVESVRDVYSLKITLPLGNPNLKLVHTNQFLFTDLPSDVFDLANMDAISQALNSTYSRYSGYEKNRWYIEGVTITNDGSSAKMELDLNPFASTLISFKDSKNEFLKAYSDAVSSNSSSNSSSKKTTVKSVGGANSSLKGGEGKTIDDLVKKIVGNETKDLKKAKLIHEWLKKNVRYSYYQCTKYNTPAKCYNNRGHLNCADTARLTASMMRSAGLNAWVVHRSSNNGHFWTLIKIDGKIYASDQTGNGSAFNTIWYSNNDRRTCNSRGGNWDRKNGKNPDC